MIVTSDYKKKLAFSLMVCVLVILAASVGFASEGGDGHAVPKDVLYKDFAWRVFNFVVLAAVMIWAIAKAKVKASLADRQKQIEVRLDEANKAKSAAEEKLREYNSKLENASKEIDDLRAVLIRDAEQEKQRIVSEAQKAAENIIAQAGLSAAQEVSKARLALQAEAGRLAVEIATGKLAAAVQKNDHDRFVSEYLGKVGQLQ